jgi:hypothetical protein
MLLAGRPRDIGATTQSVRDGWRDARSDARPAPRLTARVESANQPCREKRTAAAARAAFPDTRNFT